MRHAIAVRIIAGTFRGRTLRTPRGRRIRPTPDRVREALFSMLGDVEDFTVLDLCAGTGAIGLEALSRGARHATFVDRHVEALLGNIDALEVKDRTTIIRDDVERALARLDERFDLIFADPPYSDANVVLPQVLRRANDILEGDGIVVVEHAKNTEPPDPGHVMQHERSRTYGETTLSFYASKDEP